jgi:hypothetical protein
MTTMIPERNGIFAWIDEAEYHADRGSLSVSGAKLLLPPSCPAKFRAQQDSPQKPKRIFEFGHFVHLKVLGVGPKVVEIEADSYRTKAAREARDKARADGNIPVLVGNPNDDAAAELEQAEAMAAAIFAHPVAGPLLTHTKNEFEQSVYAIDPITNVRLRGRFDAMHFGDDGVITIVDVKTSATANPAELIKKFYNLGYFMQAAWYLDLLLTLDLAVDPQFRFVVVEKDPPYLVTPVRYTEAALEEGRRRNRRAIDLYAECHERDSWPGYFGSDGVVTLDLPTWASYDWATSDDAAFAEPDHITLNDLIEID